MIGALRMFRQDPAYRFALDQTCFIEPFLNAYPSAILPKWDEGRLKSPGHVQHAGCQPALG
jgi:hypothetical protein